MGFWDVVGIMATIVVFWYFLIRPIAKSLEAYIEEVDNRISALENKVAGLDENNFDEDDDIDPILIAEQWKKE